MNEKEQGGREEDIIQLDKEEGIRSLRKLCIEKNKKSPLTKDI